MFYANLSQYYDGLFPFKEEIFQFLLRFIPQGEARVLDAACGTGTYSLPLAEEGHGVCGLDLSQEMINLAKKKDKNKRVDYQIRNMLDVEGLGSLKTILCLGNSLAHLGSEEELHRFFVNARSHLIPFGYLVVQVVNFDAIMAQGATLLPILYYENVSFCRTYTPVSVSSLRFDAELTVGGKKSSDRLWLRPLLHEELLDLFSSYGFSVQAFGSFSLTPYEALRSPSLVLVGEKRSFV